MPRFHCAAALALSVIASPGPAVPSPDERPQVLAAVDGLLASWREADNAKGECVLHPDFRLTTFQGEGPTRKVHTVDRAALLNASKGLKPGDWDDRRKDVDVRIGRNGLAIVTARYLFSQDGKPTHCGLVAMQLYKDSGAWRIISFADTHNNLDGKTEAQVCPG
jgi:hypothetical protein